MVRATARNSTRSMSPFPSASNFANIASAPGSSSSSDGEFPAKMPRADDARCGGTADDDDIGRRRRWWGGGAVENPEHDALIPISANAAADAILLVAMSQRRRISQRTQENVAVVRR